MNHRPPKHVQEGGFAALEREGRVRLIGEAAHMLIKTGTPAGLFVGGALLAWLENGGHLERDFLMVTKPQSRHTAAYLWQRFFAHHDEREDETEGKE
jgi:hypothetical protein